MLTTLLVVVRFFDPQSGQRAGDEGTAPSVDSVLSPVTREAPCGFHILHRVLDEGEAISASWMTWLVLVVACAFCHALIATAAVAITIAENTAKVDPLTNVGRAISHTAAMNGASSATATRLFVRLVRVVICPFRITYRIDDRG